MNKYCTAEPQARPYTPELVTCFVYEQMRHIRSIPAEGLYLFYELRREPNEPLSSVDVETLQCYRFAHVFLEKT